MTIEKLLSPRPIWPWEIPNEEEENDGEEQEIPVIDPTNPWTPLPEPVPPQPYKIPDKEPPRPDITVTYIQNI